MAKIVRIDLHRLWSQRFEDNLKRIAHAVDLKGRAMIAFGSNSGQGSLRNGRPIESFELRRSADGQEVYDRSAGLAVGGAMSLPTDGP